MCFAVKGTALGVGAEVSGTVVVGAGAVGAETLRLRK
jgi:hypothetical protein